MGGVTSVQAAPCPLEWLPASSPLGGRLLPPDESSCAALIETDAALATVVLRLGRAISTREATATLGFRRVRNLVLTRLLSRLCTQVSTPEGWSGVRFSLHAVATGILASLLAGSQEVEGAEDAFLAGLLHDLGKLFIATSLPRQFAVIHRRLEETPRSLLASEREVVGLAHPELSAIVVGRWGLPAAVERAVACHHAPEEADGGRRHLSHLVQAADSFANRLGYWTPPRPEASAADGPPPAVFAVFQTELEVLRPLF